MSAPKTSEKYFEKKACEAVRRAGGLAIKLVAAGFTGLPDRLMLMRGARLRFVEFKSTGKPLSPRQKIVFPFLASLGFPVEIIDNEESLNEFIAEI